MNPQQTLDDNQRMLVDSARDYLSRGYGTAERDASIAHVDGCALERWTEFADLGWLALPLPEEDGGLGGSIADLCVVAEELGRNLVNEPFIACAVLGAGLLADVTTGELRVPWLAGMAQGKRRVAAAVWEPGAGFDHWRVATTAQPVAGGYTLQGAKSLVVGGAGADAYLMAASLNPATWGLFLVPAGADGLAVTVRSWYDGQKCVDLQLRAVQVPFALHIGPAAQAQALLERALQRATVTHCAETTGLMQGAFDTTLEYLRTRKQFGRVIAANQVVQHRLVDLYVEIAEARALTQAAAAALDSDSSAPNALATRRIVAGARACVALAAKHVWEESVQLHGAIGMTQECPVGQFVKRLASASTMYGSAESHLERLAGWSLDADTAAHA